MPEGSPKHRKEQSNRLFDPSLLATVSTRTDYTSEAANRAILLQIEASLTCTMPRVIGIESRQAQQAQYALTMRLALNSFKHF
jgi:hypothetical protein